MKHFVGIDLGTTNSAICTYDGSETRIWKSAEQHDVTPSAILIDRRGNKYLGIRAYNSAPWQYENAALLFKRIMGTSTPVKLPAINLTMTPEECSAEILKLLFGYLPEELRNDPETGTVITVPAAFNQMQKDATMQAAEMAGIGKVALMQEPVAAVMSVMRTRKTNGMFLIFDLGGGTLDTAIADSNNGRVNLLAHGGIAMCGGRDFDRVLTENIVKPWLLDNFDLPEDISANPQFKTLMRVATWATEKAKIELSAKESTTIILPEDDMRCRDSSGKDIYLEIPINRDDYNELINERVNEAIGAARETLAKVDLSPHDLEHIVFVGGPTNYKPLRDKIVFELGIPGNTDVNPMTAVAEGAGIFAESIDWSSQSRSRKNIRGQISAKGNLALTFNYIARTPAGKTKIAVQVDGQVAAGAEFQIDSVDTGWTSGRMLIKHGATVDVILSKPGENVFKVFVFDASGGPVAFEQDKIIITRTAATVEAIPASHSVGLAVLDKLGGRPELFYLVRSGDLLPKKGKILLKAGESLKAGSSSSLNFTLWEGEIRDVIEDNRHIGALKISGSDFDDGVIPAGADLECEYEQQDSGNIVLTISVPCIGSTFLSDKNFYSRKGGQLDFTSDSKLVIEEGQRTLDRIDEINRVVDDEKLDQARQKLESAVSLDPHETETEDSQKAMDNVLEARRLLAKVRIEHSKEIRQIDLDRCVSFFDDYVREYARASEETAHDNLAKTAQRSIDRNEPDFENLLDDLKGKNFEILWRQDWFVIERFKTMSESPHMFVDKHRFEELVSMGHQFLRSDEIDKLRDVVAHLYQIMIRSGGENDILEKVNILRG